MSTLSLLIENLSIYKNTGRSATKAIAFQDFGIKVLASYIFGSKSLKNQ